MGNPPRPGVGNESVTSIENVGEIAEILARTRQQLLDLTRRNRLINFKIATRDIELMDASVDPLFDTLDARDRQLKFTCLVETLDSDESVVQMLPASRADLQTPYTERELERKLDRLYREYRTQLEETGGNNLYLAMGFLSFAESSDSQVLQRAPLILIPIRMNRDKGKKIESYSIELHDDELDTNHSLAHKLKELAVDLPPLATALPQEDDEKGTLKPSQYLDLVRQAISSSRDTRWELDEHIVLGLFRFQKQIMWHDLDPARWPSHAPITDREMVRRVLLGAREGEEPPGIRRDVVEQDKPDSPQLHLVLDADSSQFSSLVDAIDSEPGRGLVIEGPPGTGKSQTIANLIAAAIDKGKTVLFVAEKMAALDVVYTRLDEVGLGEFCLALHGLNTNKAELAQNLKRRLDASRSRPKGGDDLQRQWQRTRDELKLTSLALRKPVGPQERPAHEVIWTIERLRQELPEAYALDALDLSDTVERDAFETSVQLLADIGREWSNIPEAARIVWQDFVPTHTEDAVLRDVGAALEDSAAKLSDLDSQLAHSGLAEAFGASPRIADWLRLAEASPETILPPVPATADRNVIDRVLANSDLDGANRLLSAVLRYLEHVETLSKIYDYQATDSDAIAAQLKGHLEPIVGVADQPDATIADLSRMAREHQDACEALRTLTEKSDPVAKLLGLAPARVQEFSPLLQKAQELIEAPDAMALYAEGIHARANAPQMFEAAQQERVRILNLLEALPEFASQRVEDTEALDEAIRIIRSSEGKWLPVLRRSFRDARRLVRGILVDPKTFSRQLSFADRLEQLRRACASRDEFAENESYKLALGLPFRGLGTDWQTLGDIVATGTRLRALIGGEAAQQALSDWGQHFERTSSIIDDMQARLVTIEQFRRHYAYPQPLWQRPVAEIARTLEPHARRLEEASTALSLDSVVQSAPLKTALDGVSRVRPLARRAEAEIPANSAFSVLFGEGWSGAETDPSGMQQALQWVADCVEKPAISQSVLRWLVPTSEGPSSDRLTFLHRSAMHVRHALATVNRSLTQCGELHQRSWFEMASANTEQLADKFRRAAGQRHALTLLAAWHRLKTRADGFNLSALVEEVRLGRLVGAQAATAYQAGTLLEAMKAHVQAHPTLRNFSGTVYEELRQRFIKSDREMFELAALEIAAGLLKKEPPLGVSAGRVGALTELGLIRHQIGLKRNHRPIRYLVSKAGNAMQVLKPCFLMSPMSVAQFLPRGEVNFDLLVMDEASQIRPEDALGAVARATTCVIVGDPKQLPPTAFFEAATDTAESDDDYVTDNVESILDICLKQLPFRRLTWHYRSEHESLIQFSNERFYDGDLRVIPSARRSARDLGVHATFVEQPSYRRGGYNRGEAEVVVGKILETLERFPNATIGAAAMNRRQAEEIEALLERAKRDRPGLDEVIAGLSEPLFIKNLENVQGDERDVIVISTTYGPEEAGAPVAQRFGPINSDVGWRRLNVIATRARQRVELVTSLRPSDILLGENAKRGAREFRAYLEYAFHGRVSDTGTPTSRSPDSPFELAVIAHIERMGYRCEPQIGVAGFFIDIGVVHPDRDGEFVLGIECDGATYHSSPSVRDRDRLRQEILERKGWSIHRIWSTSWFHARSIELDRLKDRIEQAILEARGRAATEFDWTPAAQPEPFEGELESRIEAEEVEHHEDVASQLERFWQANIKEQFPNRETSLLSPDMIKLIASRQPYDREDFQSMIPQAMREKINPREMAFLDDVLDIVSGLA